MRALPRLLLVVVGALLVGAVMAMHALGMPMSTTAAHGMHGAITPATAAHAGATTSVSAEPSACASTHCAAARGSQPVAAQALPTTAFVVPTSSGSIAAPTVDHVASPSRAPPRSGSCSPLCVWRQ